MTDSSNRSCGASTEGLEYDLVCHEADALRNADSIIMENHVRYIGEENLRVMMTKLRSLVSKSLSRSALW